MNKEHYFAIAAGGLAHYFNAMKRRHISAAALRDWRELMNISRGEAAALLDISRGHYNLLESGKAPISKNTAAACALYLLQKSRNWIAATGLFTIDK